MSIITLENMEFHAYHGCLDHEKTLGNTFVVSLAMTLDTAKAEKSDELADTLNYQKVYDVVKRVMDTPVDLIEHLARKISDAVISEFEQIEQITLKLSKLNPPLGGKVEKVSIEIMERIR